MEREEFFSPSSVNIDNLNALSTEHSITFERRICELSELCDEAVALASELSAASMSIYEILGFISDGMDFSSTEPHGEAMPRNLEALRKHLESLSSQDMACFSSILSERLRDNNISVTEADFLKEGYGV